MSQILNKVKLARLENNELWFLKPLSNGQYQPYRKIKYIIENNKDLVS